MTDNSNNPWANNNVIDNNTNPWETAASSSSSSSSSLSSDVSNLDTILFRFASTSDSKFESAVQRVLPNILPSLRRNEAEIRNKIIEILNHINKRIKVLPTLQLPVSELIMMFIDPQYIHNSNTASSAASSSSSSSSSSPSSSSSFFFTFTLMFIEKGFARLDKREQSLLAPHLLLNSAAHPISQQKTILHILLASLSTMQYKIDNEDMREKWKFAQQKEDKELLLTFLLDILLFSPSAIKAITTTNNNSNNQSTSNSTVTVSSAPPEGLSPFALSFVTNDGKINWTSDEINKHKLWILAFLAALSHSNSSSNTSYPSSMISTRTASPDLSPTTKQPILSDTEIFPLLLVATCTGSDEVIREAENIIRRMKHLQLEDPSLLSSLYLIFLGSLDNNKIPVERKRTPAGIPARLKILGYLIKTPTSVTQSLPSALKLTFDSFFSANSNYRLKYSALFFCAHLIKNAPLPALTAITQLLVNALLRLLGSLSSTQNTSTGTTPAAMTGQQAGTLRGLIYHHLGLLSTRVPDPFTKNLKMLQLFFKALTDEQQEDTIQQVHEGLVYLRTSFSASLTADLSSTLQQMLLELANADDKRVRLNALTCLNRFFSFSDTPSRWMCLMLSNDSSIEMRDEARRGLTPFSLKEAKLNEIKGRQKRERDQEQEKSTAMLIDDSEKESSTLQTQKMEIDEKESKDEIVNMDTSSTPSSSAIQDSAVPADIPYPLFPTFIDYTANQLKLSSSPMTAALSTNLDHQVFIHLLDFIWSCYIDSAKQQSLTTVEYANQLAATPGSAASLLQYQSLLELAFLSPLSDIQSTASKHLVSLVTSLPSFFAPLYLNRLDWLKKYLLGNSAEGRANMALLLSLIVSQMQQEILTALIQEMSDLLATASHLASASDSIHGSILALGVLLAESSKRHVPVTSAIAKSTNLLIARLDNTTFQRDPALSAAACISIGRIGQEGPLAVPLSLKDQETPQSADEEKIEKKPRVDINSFDRLDVVNRLLDLTKGTDRKQNNVTEEAVRSLGLMVKGDPSNQLIRLILTGLFAMVTLKHEEIHFAVGETLAYIADVTSHNNTSSSNATPIALSNNSSSASPPYMQEILTFATENLRRGSQIARAASCTWILCIVKYSKQLPHSSFPVLQSVLTVALTDSYQFTQEAASKALSIIYEKTDDPKLKDELIATLMKTFNVGQRKVTDDTLVEIDSEKGEYSTYKELVNVANDMGQPDLVYKFLDVASHHSIWQSKLGAAFSLQSIIKTNSALSSKIGDIVPKLYLYQYDPNPKIKDSMQVMWQSLIDHPKQTIDKEYHPIMKHLLKSQGNRQFRVRLAACLGLVDLISHRSFDEVSPYLVDLWNNVYRCLDDVNGETRKAAVTLSNTLSQLCIRLGDPTYSPKSSVQQTLDLILPILLRDGITSRAREIQGISIKTLLALIKTGGTFLRPHLAELLGSLLEGMSTMESSAFSYLQFHAAAMNLTDEQMEIARLSVAKNTPLSDAVSSCLHVVDADSLASVVAKLSELLHQGLGLPTLTATAKFIINLVNSSIGPAMKDTPGTGQLMSALVNGLNDQSTSVRKVFAAALGYMCKVSKKKRVGNVIEGLLFQYTGDDSNESKRLNAGIAVNQIVNHASELVKEDFFPLIAPYAFLASHDTDADCSKLWGEIFDEMVPAKDSGAITYQTEIMKLILTTFESSSWTLRQTSYLALNSLINAIKQDTNKYTTDILPLIIKAIPGRIWNGKEKIFTVAISLCKQVKVAHEMKEEAKSDDVDLSYVDDVVQPLLRAIIEETKRNKTEFKRSAIDAVGEIVDTYDKEIDSGSILNEMKEVFDPLFDTAVNSVVGDQSSSITLSLMNEKAAEEYKAKLKSDESTAITLYEILGKMFPHTSYPSSQQQQLPWMIQRLLQGLTSGMSWNVRVKMLNSNQQILTKSNLKEKVIDAESLTKIIDALIVSAGDTKHSVVRVAALESLKALVTHRDLAEVAQLLSNSNLGKIRALLDARREDKESGVLRLIEQIKGALSELPTS